MIETILTAKDETGRNSEARKLNTTKCDGVKTMPTIRVDDDVWNALKKLAVPFEDSPNDVLRRVFHIDNSSVEASNPRSISALAGNQEAVNRTRVRGTHGDGDHSYRQITGYRLGDSPVTPADSYGELLLSLSNELHRKHGRDFEKVALELRGRKRPYFSENAGHLRRARPLLGGRVFVETNLPHNATIKICRALLKKLNYDPGKLELLT